MVLVIKACVICSPVSYFYPTKSLLSQTDSILNTTQALWPKPQYTYLHSVSSYWFSVGEVNVSSKRITDPITMKNVFLSKVERLTPGNFLIPHNEEKTYRPQLNWPVLTFTLLFMSTILTLTLNLCKASKKPNKSVSSPSI